MKILDLKMKETLREGAVFPAVKSSPVDPLCFIKNLLLFVFKKIHPSL